MSIFLEIITFTLNQVTFGLQIIISLPTLISTKLFILSTLLVISPSKKVSTILNTFQLNQVIFLYYFYIIFYYIIFFFTIFYFYFLFFIFIFYLFFYFFLFFFLKVWMTIGDKKTCDSDFTVKGDSNPPVQVDSRVWKSPFEGLK